MGGAQEQTVGPTSPTVPASQKRVIPTSTTQDVPGRLREARARNAGLFEFGPISRLDFWWDDMNARMDEKAGLQFGFSYQLTFQAATSGPGDRSGAEGDLDLSAAWRVIGTKDDDDTGTINVNAQHIHEMGETGPANLSGDIGAIWATSDGWGYNQDFVVDQAYFEQYFLDGNAMVVVGKIDTTNYVNTNRFADDSVYFMNTAFSANPALLYPDNGLGIVGAGHITKLVYLGGCIADANGQATMSGFDSIGYGDFFYAVEAGLTPTINGLGDGAYRFTGWYSQDAEKLNLPEDYGFAISCDQQLGNGVSPFLRYAWSDGAATGVRNIAAVGACIEGCFGRKDDVFGLGVSWGDSPIEAYSDQVAGEVFYRLQVTAAVQFTLGGQVIANALDRETGENGETVGIIEARFRVAF